MCVWFHKKTKISDILNTNIEKVKQIVPSNIKHINKALYELSREDDTTSKLSLFLDLLVDIIKKQFSFKCKNLINLVSEATDTFDYDIPISYDEFSIWFRNHLQIHKLNEVENKYLKQENKELNNQIAEVNDRVRNETVKLNLEIK